MLDTATYLSQHISDYTEYSYLYYECAGELVGTYKYEPRLVRDSRDINAWVDTESRDVVADISKVHSVFQVVERESLPKFFNQQYFKTTPIKRDQDERKHDYLNQKTSWQNSITAAPVLRLKYNYYSNFGTRIYTLDDEGYEENIADEIVNDFTLYLGEFFLLNNTIQAIKKINLKSEILIDQENSIAFPEFDRLPTFTDDRTYQNESFLEWYFGTCYITDEYKNAELDGSLYPNINHFIHAENRQRWNSIRNKCIYWDRVFDNDNFEFNDSHENYNKKKVPICSMRVDIKFDKFREYLDSLDLYNVSDDYGEGTLLDSKDIDLIIYPPSMYNYPANTVNNVIEPIINKANEPVKEVIFELPDTFKSDGNMHFKINFYASNSAQEIVFTSSSMGSDINYQKNNWYWSKKFDGPWVRIPTGDISFDNRFSDYAGIDVIFAKYIKYILSDEVYDKIKTEPILTFKIFSSDGTKVYQSNSQFNMNYKLQLTT